MTGDTLLIFTAECARIPSTGGGYLDARNDHPVVSLTTADVCVFGGILPVSYGNSGVKVLLHYAMATATSGAVKWTTAFERVGEGQQDIDSDGFATGVTAGDVTVPGTSGFVDITENDHSNGSQMDSIASGEYFRLKITRTAPGGSAATGEAQLVAVEIREQ